MSTYYHAGSVLLQATGTGTCTGYVLAQGQGQGFRDGYLDQAGLLCNEAGELLATSHQRMDYKE